MKAMLLSEYNRLEIVDLAMPRPGPDEILVRVEACGICGSDIHGYDGTSGRRIPPLVMGHEASGTVAAAGAEVSGFKQGQLVTFDSTVYCGECAFCRSGAVNLCDRRQVLGVSTPEYRRAGAFAEYLTVPARIVYAVPAEVSAVKAALVEPLAVALHAVNLAGNVAGSRALVVGAGMIGLLTIQVLRAKGCDAVVASDIDEGRLKLAIAMGATETVNPKVVDLGQRIAALTNGTGVDYGFEAVGSTPTLKSAIENVRKGGAVVAIGNIASTVEIPLQILVSRQIRLQGSAASAGEYEQCIAMLSRGEIQVEPLISAVAPLEEGPEWFQRLHAREPNLMKVVLTPVEGNRSTPA